MRSRYRLMAEALSINRMCKDTIDEHCPANG